jgi:hypothetical protein
MDKSQLAGVYGQWGGETSDLDLDNIEEGSSFAKDPSPEDIQFLASAVNLSPNCLPGARCTEIDVEPLRNMQVDAFLTLGYRHTVRYIPDYVDQIEDITGKKVIYIDISQTGPDCRPGNEDRCYGKSMIDLIKQMHELAVALGVNIPASVKRDEQELCEAAANFQQVSREAQLKGVRVMAAYLAGGIEGTTFLANPPDDMVLRMFEELGMPLLHVSCDLKPDEKVCPLGFFWEHLNNTDFFGCQADVITECSNENPKYPVDFWLYDDRITLEVTDPSFARDKFPDKALLAGQMAYWPIGADTLSYRHAAKILNIVAPALADARRIHDGTQCTPDVDVGGVAHRTVGLDGGEYACYNENFHRQEYLTCPKGLESGKTLSTGAIVGIAVGASAFLLVLVVLLVRWGRRAATEKEVDAPSVEMSSGTPNYDVDEHDVVT